MRQQARWWSPPAAPQPAPGYAARVTGSVLLPVLTVVSAVWFAVFAIIMYSLWWSYRHGDLGAWPPGMFHGDPDFPRWVAFAAVVAVYAFVAIPISAGRRAALYYANGGDVHGWAHAWAGMLWVAVVAVLLLIAMYQLPQLQELWRDITGGSHSVLTAQELLPAPQVMPALAMPTLAWPASWPTLDVAYGNDLVTAFAARGGHIDAVALGLAYQGPGNR